jgi:uncharacterized protein (DUF2062 family)
MLGELIAEMSWGNLYLISAGIAIVFSLTIIKSSLTISIVNGLIFPPILYAGYTVMKYIFLFTVKTAEALAKIFAR